MEYKNVAKGKFISRPNRFTALVDTKWGIETCHVKTTGRCAELLRPGASVFIAEAENNKRKTTWDLISVESGVRLVNIDSQAPNKTAPELFPGLFGDINLIRPEFPY